MSTWYQVDVTAFGNNSDLARMLHLDEDDITGDTSFTISCGRKNMPGIQYPKIIKNNPNLVFLVKTAVECNAVYYELMKYNPSSDSFSEITLEKCIYESISFNKKIWEQFPELNKKFIRDKKINWDFFVTYNLEIDIPRLLRSADQYEEFICLMSEDNDDILISRDSYLGDE